MFMILSIKFEQSIYRIFWYLVLLQWILRWQLFGLEMAGKQFFPLKPSKGKQDA